MDSQNYLRSPPFLLSVATKIVIIGLLIACNIKVNSLLSCIISSFRNSTKSSSDLVVCSDRIIYPISNFISIRKCTDNISVIANGSAPILILSSSERLVDFANWLNQCSAQDKACKNYRALKMSQMEALCRVYIPYRKIEYSFICLDDPLKPYLVTRSFKLTPLETLSLGVLLSELTKELP